MKVREKRQPRVLALALTLVLVLGSCVPAMAADAIDVTKTTYVQGYIKPDVTVKYNAETMAFSDVNGEAVYPIIYNGSTYLPVRAISSLMNKDIEWRPTLNTIFIGKTLANPTGLARPRACYATTTAIAVGNAELKPALVTLAVRPQFQVMYDFNLMEFKDANEKTIYPIVYDGSTYLPVRAISALMNQAVEWDADLKIVYIGSKTPLTKEEIKVHQVPKSTKDIQNLYADVADLYTNATASISTLQTIKTADEFTALANQITSDLKKAEELKEKARALKTQYENNLGDSEIEALEKLIYFSAVNEAYIETMENIVYMLLNGENIMILQEAFEQFALDAMNSCEATRLALEAL